MRVLTIVIIMLICSVSFSFSDYRDHSEPANMVFFENGIEPCYSLQMIDKYIYGYLIYEFIGCGKVYECFVSKYFGTYYHNDYVGVDKIFVCYFYDYLQEP